MITGTGFNGLSIEACLRIKERLFENGYEIETGVPIGVPCKIDSLGKASTNSRVTALCIKI